MNKFIMRRLINYMWVGSLLIFLCVVRVYALEVPELKGRVNDYAGMLSSATVNQLEIVLSDLERTDSTQIVVLTLLSLEGENIEDYSIRVADVWKIGRKNLDNGAILIISKNDRKLRIEVGYGLEGTLTDLVAGRIISNIIVPQFKTGNFDRGVIAGVQSMIHAVHGEFNAEGEIHRPEPRVGAWPSNLFSLIVFTFLVNRMGRVRRRFGILSGGILFPILWGMVFNFGFFWSMVMIPIGALGGFAMSFLGSPLRSNPSSPQNRHGGGFWLGGGSGGSGFGSGGFGGFSGGGGGFGGGGASGGW
ncbi:TPM domain-containing protein [Desulforapulum autotrophicum]|nr:TPM domain-containing protein [Desulforapulum autotrophicum]